MKHWRRVDKGDPVACWFADQHYNRRTHGAPQFMPPGQTIVLLTHGHHSKTHGAVFGWWRPDPKHFKTAMNGLDGWTCTIFRHHGGWVARDLIRDAEAAMSEFGYDVGPDGLITYVNPQKISSEVPGYCFRRAGYRHRGWSADRKLMLFRKRYLPERYASRLNVQEDLWEVA